MTAVLPDSEAALAVVSAVSEADRWLAAYQAGIVATPSADPSSMVRLYADRIPAGSGVADLGAGGGHNSLYLARRGHSVDAVDHVDTGWHRGVPGVHFEQRSVENLDLGARKYGAVIMAGLFEFLPREEVESLVRRSVHSLIGGGILFLNYHVTGGVHEAPELDVAKYAHPIRIVTSLTAIQRLDTIFNGDDVAVQQSTTQRLNVAHSYELVAQKPR